MDQRLAKLAFITNPLINLLITFMHVGLKGLVCARQTLVTLVPFIPFYARAGTQHDFTMGPGTAMHRKSYKTGEPQLSAAAGAPEGTRAKKFQRP